MPLVTGVQTCALPIYSIELKDQVGDITNAWILQQEADCRLGVQRNGGPSNFDLNSSFCQEILGRITRLDAPGTPNDQQVEEIVRRSEEHTSELQSLMRISYAVFCLKKKRTNTSVDTEQ